MIRARITRVGKVEYGDHDSIVISGWAFTFAPGCGAGVTLDGTQSLFGGYSIAQLERISTMHRELGYWVL